MIRELRELESCRDVEIGIAADTIDDRFDGTLHRAEQRASNIAEPFDFPLKRDAFAGDRLCVLDFLRRSVGRQPERERGTFSQYAPDRQVATHQSGQSPADREPEPTPLARASVSALRLHERIENGHQFLIGNSGTGIRYAKAHIRTARLEARVRIGCSRRRYLHRDLSAVWCEL